jgi:hypothetical protein
MGCSQPGLATTITVPSYTSTAPSSPGMPRISVGTPNNPSYVSALVSWDAVPNASHYKIIADCLGEPAEFCQPGQVWWVSKSAGLSGYINLTPGRTYRISIVACNDNGCSQPGPAVVVDVPFYTP